MPDTREPSGSFAAITSGVVSFLGAPHVPVEKLADHRIGEEDGLVFCGGSLALDPDAGVLAQAEPGAEHVLSADVGEPGRRDARTRYRDLLRDELYLQRV
jgi:predicted amidohydrolase